MINTIMLDCGGVVTYPLTGEWMMAPGLDELKAKYNFTIDEERARREEEMAKEVLRGKTDAINYRAAKGIMARAINRLRIKKRYGKYN